ncbi:MAG: PTS sugar transporter subunit IIA, partial [Candidatus Methylomirabilis sp.]|nr:PTS sugar transporter subunit IIA [Deltaproteobacteria bacterium]
MKLTEILTESVILPELKAETKKAALRELAASVCAATPGLEADRVLGILMDREKLGSTGVGGGAAVPHGKLPGAHKMLAALGRSRAGIDYESADGQPVRLLFLLLAPENAQQVHLQALAKICRVFKNESVREALLDAEGSAQILEILRKEDE